MNLMFITINRQSCVFKMILQACVKHTLSVHHLAVLYVENFKRFSLLGPLVLSVCVGVFFFGVVISAFVLCCSCPER